jgi:uncharacterized membrane protein
MPTVEQSIDVHVHVSTAYDQWTRFDSFPRWMEGVASVGQFDDNSLHWVAKVRSEFAAFEGETREWDARITEQTHNKRVAWESVGGNLAKKPDAGAATFDPLDESRCRVTFHTEWEPEDARETPAEMLEAVSQVVAADLARFKDLIEAHAEETGPRRVEIAV